MEIENSNENQQQKKLKITLIIIGILLICSSLRSYYYSYKMEENYELKGWQTATATCIQEDPYYSLEGNTQYKRTYLYIVSGQEYTLNSCEFNIFPYKLIKYDSSNPHIAKIYKKNNIEIVIFFIGLICLFSPLILKFIGIKKINELKYKILNMSKRNIIKITRICFYGYMGLSLIFVLRETFFTPNWNQLVTQYSQSEIILECAISIIVRCIFKKYTCHFIIFRI